MDIPPKSAISTGGMVVAGHPLAAEAGKRVLTDGGNAIPYHMEDPYIREMFEAKLSEVGAESTMPKVVYTEAGAKMEVLTDE